MRVHFCTERKVRYKSGMYRLSLVATTTTPISSTAVTSEVGAEVYGGIAKRIRMVESVIVVKGLVVNHGRKVWSSRVEVVVHIGPIVQLSVGNQPIALGHTSCKKAQTNSNDRHYAK